MTKACDNCNVNIQNACVMRNLIYLFKVLYDIAYDRGDASKCAPISINHSKTTIDLHTKDALKSKIHFCQRTLLPKSTQWILNRMHQFYDGNGTGRCKF